MRSRLGVTALVAGVFAIAGGLTELSRAQPEGDFDHWAHYTLEACFSVFVVAAAVGFWLLRGRAGSALARAAAAGAAAGHALIGVALLALIVESLRRRLDPRWFAPLCLVSVLASAPLDGSGGLALWSLAWIALGVRELRASHHSTPQTVIATRA